MAQSPHIIIIGAGIIGLSTAYALLRKGLSRVTVLEQAKVDHQRSASHGCSRLLRFEYGDDAFYSNMVRLSLERWRRFEQEIGRTLYRRSGVLTLGRKDDDDARASYEISRGMGLPVEQVHREECHRRFPQFDTSAFNMFVYNAEGGILLASSCLQALRDSIRDLGGEIHEDCRVTHLTHGEMMRPLQLYLHSGEKLKADRVVLAAGVWANSLLDYTKLPLRVTRQYLLYFAGLSPDVFAAGRFPAFLSDHLYGFPIHQGCHGWVKAASHEPGASISPDDRTPPDHVVLARIRSQLTNLLPALRSAQLARVDACMYDLSPDGDFILDHLPNDGRVTVASGLSGHGFKFGLLLGELLSSLVYDSRPAVPIERFSLNRFAVTPQSTRSAASYASLSGVSR